MSSSITLNFQQCLGCGAFEAAGSDLCPTCLGKHFKVVSVSGKGRLASWTTIRKPPLKFREQGMYHVGVVDLDEGFRVTGRFMPQEGDQVGDRVVAIALQDDDSHTPIFKAVQS
ncbi:MAG: OB-fold domain-containing protein [Burkholderiaceae bacterium]|nr:OB-fold domain-containing protein [Burkholderiaceae bacterium]